jgi:RHS repeat-associated protein
LTTHGFTFTVDSAYDDANRRTKITYPDSSFVDREYTVRDQLETIEYTNTPAGGSLTSFETLAVVYDAGMRVTDRDSGNGVEAGYAYRDDNLTETITHTGVNNFSNGANGLDFTYDYDANKNKLQETITSPVAGYGFNSSADAVYDDEDRLTEWNRDDTNRDLEWDLSLVGDWDQFTVEGTGVSRTHAAAHELTAVGASSLSLDVKGNITQDTSKTNTHNYTWDFDNRMSFADVDGTAGDEIEYTYDALGRRVSKKFPQGEDTCTILFVHSGQQILAEYKWEAATREEDSIKQQQQERTVAIGVVTTNFAATVTLLRKYQYASYIDDRCVLVDLTALGAVAAGTEELFWQHANHLYSVAALTDANANLVERYTYDAYGNITILDPAGTTVRTVSSYGNPYTFTGRRLDDETGLYHYRARYYDSALGRFVSRDPIGYHDGMSLYRGYFVPNGMDPWGLYEVGNYDIGDGGVIITVNRGTGVVQDGYAGDPILKGGMDVEYDYDAGDVKVRNRIWSHGRESWLSKIWESGGVCNSVTGDERIGGKPDPDAGSTNVYVTAACPGRYKVRVCYWVGMKTTATSGGGSATLMTNETDDDIGQFHVGPAKRMDTSGANETCITVYANIGHADEIVRVFRYRPILTHSPGASGQTASGLNVRVTDIKGPLRQQLGRRSIDPVPL